MLKSTEITDELYEKIRNTFQFTELNAEYFEEDDYIEFEEQLKENLN